MKRTTVKIPDGLDFRLRDEAKRRGLNVSQLTREALESYFSQAPRALLAAGRGASGRSDISEKIEDILRADLRP